MAAKDVDDVLAWRGQGIIHDGGHDRGQKRPAGVPAVLGIVVCALQIIDTRRDVHVRRIPELLPRGIEGPIARRLVGGDVHLEGRRKRAERIDLTQQIRRQVSGRDQPPEQRGRRGIGGHDPGVEFAPVDRAHALRTACVHQHLRHRRLRDDLHARASSTARDRCRDTAHTAAHKTPTARPLMLAHQVMHEHVCRAGGLRAGKGADRGVVREQAFDRVVLEPGRQIVVSTLSQQVDHPIRTIANRAMTP